MDTAPSEAPTIEQEELRGIWRTVAEIEWLLLVLVLLYEVFAKPEYEAQSAIAAALFFFAAFVLGFRYANFYKRESHWKIAIETWVMIAFITWTAWFTGKLASPLLNCYLLVIITSALSLGKVATLCEVALIGACFVLLGENPSMGEVFSLGYVGALLAQLAPMLLVAYVTTMFSADIRYGLSKAKVLSETDDLTALYNRRGFAILAARVFAQAVRYGRSSSVLFIDGDNFKAFNDSYGHEAGDRMLRLVARCIESELRQTDILGRYGGDEFVALLPETPAGAAIEVGERIRAAVAGSPLQIEDRSVIVSVSIGVASFPEDGQSLDILMARADRAMYRAKQEGRNEVVKFAA